MSKIDIFEAPWMDGSIVTVIRTPLHTIYIFDDGTEQVFEFNE